MNATDTPASCPSCGSTDLIESLRDTFPEAGTIPPPHTFGHWVVCQSCGHQWPANEEAPQPKEGTDG